MTKEEQAEINHFRLVRELLEGTWTMAKFEIFAEINDSIEISDDEMAHLLKLAIDIYTENDQATTLGVAQAVIRATEDLEEPFLDIFSITLEDLQTHWEIGELL